MADFVFNVSKGKVNAYHDRVNDNDPANSALIVVLLQDSVTVVDATLLDMDDLGTILGTYTECDFTSYVRKVLTDSDVAASAVDDTNDRREADIPDQTWTSAGGASNNNVVKLLICYDPDTTAGTDSSIVPLTAHDFVITTNGSDVTAQIAAAGYFRAS